MFNDERINTESGKIYRRGILYATLVTLLYAALRAAYLAIKKQLFIQYLFGYPLCTRHALSFPAGRAIPSCGRPGERSQISGSEIRRQRRIDQ